MVFNALHNISHTDELTYEVYSYLINLIVATTTFSSIHPSGTATRSFI